MDVPFLTSKPLSSSITKRKTKKEHKIGRVTGSFSTNPRFEGGEGED